MFRTVWFYIAIICLVIISVIFLWFYQSTPSKTAVLVIPTPQGSPSPEPSPTLVASQSKTIRTSEILNNPKQFNFSAEIPTSWQAEISSSIEAINIFDPTVKGDTNLEKSQIFIRHFSANSFLTLSTVDVLERQELTISGKPAVKYVIAKKASVANFANQPSWRNLLHTVTDIRLVSTNSSTFYVIAKRPDLEESVYQRFLDTLKLSAP